MSSRDATAQLTVRLPSDLNHALKGAARQMQRKRSDVVRIALRQYLGLASATQGRPLERVRGLIGSLESGIPNLAEQHRKFILESLKHGR
ncbi:MAG TPA: ribbon-helix-helix protein, CopG family [Acidobacteriota bacterium]